MLARASRSAGSNTRSQSRHVSIGTVPAPLCIAFAWENTIFSLERQPVETVAQLAGHVLAYGEFNCTKRNSPGNTPTSLRRCHEGRAPLNDIVIDNPAV